LLVKIINILLLLLLFRLLVPVFRWIGGGAAGSRSGGKKAPPQSPAAKDPDYSDLTSHEIEDADFEEIKEK
jgi:hypothetical protein